MEHFEDPVISRMQSALSRALPEGAADSEHMRQFVAAARDLDAQRKGLEHKAKESVMRRHTRDYKAGSCPEIYIKLALAHLYDRQADLKKLEEEFNFSMCDPRWIEAWEEYLKIYHADSGHFEIPYVRYHEMSDFVFEGFPDDCKVGVLGDWGTGDGIAFEVLDRMLELRPDAIIHLGDVYYAGEEKEYRKNLVEPLHERVVKPDGSPVPVFNMSGNHDMYSGGAPFYAATGRLNGDTQFRQEASYFCLRTANGKWQILGADTGLHDHDPFAVVTSITHLDPEEVKWHANKVEEFSRDGGRTVFMTHHQPFSANIPMGSPARKKPSDFYVNPRLLDDFNAIRTNGDVPLWLWGHEHNLAIFQPFRGIERGRCAGHSAVPVLAAETDPYKLHHCSKLERDLFYVSLLKGHWGKRLLKEYRTLRRLMKRDPKVPVPQLVSKDGQEVKLPVVPEAPPGGDELPAMYEHGFTFMNFGVGPDRDGVRVDYYGGDGSAPLFSETL